MFFLPCGWLIVVARCADAFMVFSFHYPGFRVGSMNSLPMFSSFFFASIVFLGGRRRCRTHTNAELIGLGILCVSNIYYIYSICDLLYTLKTRRDASDSLT